MRTILFAVLALLFLSCSTMVQNDDDNGTASEVIAFTGRVTFSDGTPAAKVSVNVRDQHACESDPAHSVKPFETRTDESGEFYFESADTGSYSIECYDSTDRAVLFRTRVSRTDTGVGLNGTLARMATVSGAVPDAQDALVEIAGLKRAVTTDSSGLFEIRVPAGSYDLRITDRRRGEKSWVRIDDVHPGASVDLGEVYVFADSFTGLNLRYSTVRMPVGAALDLYPAGEDGKRLSDIICSSSDESVVSIDETGRVFSLSPGKVVVTVKMADDLSEEEACSVMVFEELQVDDFADSNFHAESVFSAWLPLSAGTVLELERSADFGHSLSAYFKGSPGELHGVSLDLSKSQLSTCSQLSFVCRGDLGDSLDIVVLTGSREYSRSVTVDSSWARKSIALDPLYFQTGESKLMFVYTCTVNDTLMRSFTVDNIIIH